MKDENLGSKALENCEHPGIRRNTALGCYVRPLLTTGSSGEGFKILYSFKVVCAEHKLPPFEIKYEDMSDDRI